MSAAVRFGAVLPQGVTNELASVAPEHHARTVRRYVREVEEAGFASVWVSDHVQRIRPGDLGGSHEGWTLLAAASQWTERVELGQLVMCVGFRNPALLAKMAASLDVLSGGRVVLGMGAGWHEAEHVGYGFPFGPPAERVARLAEALEIVRGMLDDDRPTYDGRYYRTVRAECDPHPLRGRLPLLVGGRGRTTLRIAARFADRVNVTGGAADVAAAFGRLDEGCAAVGRDPGAVERTWMTLGVLVRETEAEVRRAVDGLAEVARQRLQVAGTPAQVAEQLRAYVDLGCAELIVNFSEAPRTEPVRLFAEAVVPAVRS